jgi:alkanesulfonate monooxygenase
VRALWTGEPVTLEGTHLHVEDAVLQQIPDPLPPIYLGGSSPAAGRVAAKHVDVYLTWGEPPAAVAEKVDWIRRLAAEEGREIRFGIRLHTIARDTSEAAWAEADRLLSGISEDDIKRVQDGLKRSESVGQRRMLDLNQGTKDGLVIHPNLWAGVGLVRGGAGTAMVGSYAEIADLIEQYRAVGIEEFVLSGYPHLEEAYWFGEGVLPELERRGLWKSPAPAAGSSYVPFGRKAAAP